MANKHHKPEEIVAKLRQAEVLVGHRHRDVPNCAGYLRTANVAYWHKAEVQGCNILGLVTAA